MVRGVLRRLEKFSLIDPRVRLHGFYESLLVLDGIRGDIDRVQLVFYWVAAVMRDFARSDLLDLLLHVPLDVAGLFARLLVSHVDIYYLVPRGPIKFLLVL